MQSLKFKTNLKCNGCVNAIKPRLEGIKEIKSWHVDLENPDRIVEIIPVELADDKLTDKIINEIEQAGYTAQKI